MQKVDEFDCAGIVCDADQSSSRDDPHVIGVADFKAPLI